MLLPEELSLNNLPGMSAVAFPPTDITTGATLKTWSMYLLQFSGVISVNQNSSMYCVSSSLVDGFLLDTCRFNWFHTISMGFRSGDSDGHFHQLLPNLIRLQSLERCYHSTYQRVLEKTCIERKIN